MTSISTCLDRIWGGVFKETRMHFGPAKRKYIQHRVHDPICGNVPSKGDTGYYCGGTATYYVLIPEDMLRPSAAAFVAKLISHEYGHHVQHWTHILDYEAVEGDATTRRATADLLSRRLELQAECFAGVALKAMRSEDLAWRQFRDLYVGITDDPWAHDHGRQSTRLKWLEKGHRSGRAGACDTWSASKREVT
ncbi:neutral zinc metallopeptidase [Sphaerisporangium sp. NPDC005288]|uniref:neutral zinc metallopeptidase n=1 Tax=Sphaerisporangium sp. NPDC005288 TaxID=3155114 RepID=UPI0033AE83E9